MEKWSDWKSSFFETIGNFSALPVYQDSDAKEKCKDFSMENPFAKTGFRYRAGWKNPSVFFSEKNELQLQWISIKFARFLNVRIPKCYVAADTFSNKFYLFSSRRDQDREKTEQAEKSSITDLYLQKF